MFTLLSEVDLIEVFVTPAGRETSKDPEQIEFLRVGAKDGTATPRYIVPLIGEFHAWRQSLLQVALFARPGGWVGSRWVGASTVRALGK